MYPNVSTVVRIQRTRLFTFLYCTFLVAQTVKNLPAMQETGVRSLDGGDPLEKGMATRILA